MSLNTFEKAVIDSWRNDEEIPENIEPTDQNILWVCLLLTLQLGKILRSKRNKIDVLEFTRKEDGSVLTPMDGWVEDYARKRLLQAFPRFNFIGEEGGGRFEPDTLTAAIDPIDGSWSFIAHDSTYAVSLGLLRNENIFLGIVVNPSTGELGYAQKKMITRLIQLSCFGEPDTSRDLPSADPQKTLDRILVNIQPAKGYREYENALKNAWNQKEINYVKSAGGSPALALLETAKGHYIYVHPWQTIPAKAFDLAAGVKLVENAGGRVVDLMGYRVNPVGHSGVFIAGVNAEHIDRVRSILYAGT